MDSCKPVGDVIEHLFGETFLIQTASEALRQLDQGTKPSEIGHHQLIDSDGKIQFVLGVSTF
jgi:hypothetical protein